MFMRRLLPLALLTLAPLPAFAQTTPVAPIEKGTGLPPPSSEEAAILAPIQALLAGLAARDGQAMLAAADPSGRVTVAEEKPDGSRSVTRLSWSEFTAAIKPGTARLQERIGTPAIEADGDIAMVWAPYTFLVDGTPHHCGTNHFDLLRSGGAWKILNVTYTHRATGCTAR
jgi:hypothetical protein